MKIASNFMQKLKKSKKGFRKPFSAIALAVLGVGVFATPALAASLISNGSFESGTDPEVFSTVSAGDSTTITNWTVSSGSVDYIGTYWEASDGDRSIDLSGNTPGSLQQTFSTVAGQKYFVTFDMAGNPDGGSAVKTLTVNTTGGTPVLYSFNSTGQTHEDMGWEQKVYSFIASGPTTTLTFTSTTGDAYGPAIDNVELAGVPTNKNQCKNGGWMNLVDNSGHPFVNQGQCAAYVNGNKNVNKVKNTNNVTVTNNSTQTATTGNARVTNNTTGGNATSGDAGNSNSTSNTVNVSNSVNLTSEPSEPTL